MLLEIAVVNANREKEVLMIKSEEVNILKTLDELNIKYERIEHPPVATVAEAKEYGIADAEGCKNLFLYDKKNDRYYLVIMLEDKKAHSNTIRRQAKSANLTFGSEEGLYSLLGVRPGSVNPFGVINDIEKKVTILIDEDLPKYKKVCFHPNINTATLIISYEDFLKFIEWTGNIYKFICVTKPLKD